MEDFASLMSREGVRRLDAKPQPAIRRAATPASVQITRSVEAPASAPVAPAIVAREPVAWDAGPEAPTILQKALTRLLIEGGRVEMLVRQNGSLATVNMSRVATVPELLAAADAADAELVILDGAAWKVIMHPKSGIATLVDNPETIS